MRSSALLAGGVVSGTTLDRMLLGLGTGDVHGESGPSEASSLIALLSAIVADLEKKFPYASALYASQDGVTLTRDRHGKNVSEVSFRGRGVSLRVFDGAAFHEAAVEKATEDALRRAAGHLQSEVSLAAERYRIQPLSPLERSWKTEMETDPASLSLADRASALEAEFARVTWDDPRVRGAELSTEEFRRARIFVDRNRKLSSETLILSHNASLFGFENGRPGYARVRRVGQGGQELARLSDEQIESLRKELVDSFGAEPVPAGEYDVVMAPAVTGLLAHESFGHGVEMDQFVKKRAKAQAFLGKKVASEIVHLVDDPSIPGVRGSYPFDDEGMLAAPTRVLQNGVFVRPLTDLMSATFLGTERTPNGRTQGYDRKVYARMSNTFIDRGTSKPAELLAGLEDGLYLEGFRNGIEDPQGWGIQFTVRLAREVKKGKLTGRVFAPITVSGYVPEILSNISQVADDFELEPGNCGKGFKEYVPVTGGGPTIRTRARIS